MKITLEIPDQLGLSSSPDELSKQFLLSHALILFKEGKISIGLAKDLAGIHIYDFMQICGKHGIPVINYSAEELESEIEAIRNHQL